MPHSQLPTISIPPAALYVHVPFCLSKCRYCDFYSRPLAASNADAYIQALKLELELWKPRLPMTFDTIFLGGGTPTALPPQPLRELLALLQPMLAGDGEWTIEANPSTATQDVIDILADSGINRVSLGAQTFDDNRLTMLGRRHRASDVGPAIQRLRQAGIDNISLDLIYGLPHSNIHTWQCDLLTALTIGVEHVSCYALSYEEGTPLWTDLHANRFDAIDDETQRLMYAQTRQTLRAAGLAQYELSNFAKPDRQCRHNLTYWQNESYLGIGPAAASYLGGQRRTNLADTEAWMANLQADRWPAVEAETLTGRHAAAETLMLGLRLVEGIDPVAFADRHGQTPEGLFPASIGRQQDIGTLIREDGRLKLRPRYYFTADAVLADILAEATN